MPLYWKLRLTRSRFAAALASVAMLSFTWQVLFAATGSQTKTVLSMFLVMTLLLSVVIWLISERRSRTTKPEMVRGGG